MHLGVVMEEKPLVGSLTSLSFTNVVVRAPLFQMLNGLFKFGANYEFLQRALFSVAPVSILLPICRMVSLTLEVGAF